MMIQKSPWTCGMPTQNLTNEQTIMLWDGIPSLQKWWGKYHLNIFQFMVAKCDAMLPSHHHITRIIDDIHYFLIHAIMH